MTLNSSPKAPQSPPTHHSTISLLIAHFLGQMRGPEVEELDAKSKDLLIQQAAQCLNSPKP